jgi:hypothetical protein
MAAIPKEVFNKDGLFDELKKALAERMLNAEIDDHLDGETAERKTTATAIRAREWPGSWPIPRVRDLVVRGIKVWRVVINQNMYRTARVVSNTDR